MTYLWYIPNTVEPGHRGDDAVAGYGTLEHSVDLARTAERHGWEGALIGAVGQQRLLDLAARGDVLDSCLFTAPGRYGGGGAGTTWLVGSADDVAAALRRYGELGITHFVLSDTPYKRETARVGDALIGAPDAEPLVLSPVRRGAAQASGA